MNVDALLHQIAGRALTHRESTRTSYELARNVIRRKVPGDLVECGVYAGSQVAAMALALLATQEMGRKVHLFDSFQGIDTPGPEDHEFIAHGTKKGSAACSLDAVKQHMAEWGIPDSLLVYHPGWFADTLPGCAIGPIALLRLDGDLYESTKVCMAHLFPQVSEGGWCIIDDYPLSGCRKAVHEVVIPQPMYFQKL